MKWNWKTTFNYTLGFFTGWSMFDGVFYKDYTLAGLGLLTIVVYCVYNYKDENKVKGSD